jgi:hypothetical protein
MNDRQEYAALLREQIAYKRQMDSNANEVEERMYGNVKDGCLPPLRRGSRDYGDLKRYNEPEPSSPPQMVRYIYCSVTDVFV